VFGLDRLPLSPYAGTTGFTFSSCTTCEDLGYRDVAGHAQDVNENDTTRARNIQSDKNPQ
jgi:hypothetical protein